MYSVSAYQIDETYLTDLDAVPITLSLL